MLVRRANWWVILAVAALGPLFGAAITWRLADADSNPRPTTPAPSRADAPSAGRLDVRMPDGGSIAMSELAPGRPVAVVVMKGSWCPVCRRQLVRLSKRLEAVRRAGGSVFGLSHADPERNRRMMKELDLKFPVLSAPSTSVLQKLGLWRDDACHATPGVVYLDEQGRIEEIHRGRYPGRPQEACIIDQLESLNSR
ncbi:MAG: peroxiredoxin family protein [Bradymonadaceae bacterium]